MIRKVFFILLFFPSMLFAQINTDRVMTIARNALYFEDYVLSIQYFNQVISAKPYLYEPYFFRGVAKLNLDDFQGAEQDCTEAINRNPFVVACYQVRGLARIRQQNYDGAISDYEKALEYEPETIGLWHNLSLCKMQKEDYEGAQEDLDKLKVLAPKHTAAYLMSADVSLRQKDTLRAEQNIDKALEIDPYDGDVWSSKAILHLQQSKYKDAEADLNKAIHLASKNANNYINRALARYHQNNLRGAMSDYDLALEIDPSNFLGHYNRGLLRAQVGDDNRAIEDFNFVIEIEPENMMAIFNRGLLLDQTGDYRGAIKDFSTVIDEYPNFLTGYHYRAAARRKIGDVKGADADEFKLLKAQIDRQNGVNSNKTTADASDEKTRKKSDKNMNNYRKIVVADNANDEQRYKSEYRGKVQDRNVRVELQPMYALTYYEKRNDVKRTINYYRDIDDLNHDSLFHNQLIITNMEAPLTEKQASEHFASVNEYTLLLTKEPNNAKLRFLRGMDFYLTQDFPSAVEDFTQAILADGSFFPAYFNRALVRYKQLEYRKNEARISREAGAAMTSSDEVKAVDYELVKSDLNKVIELVPDFAFAYYNRGNIYSQLSDYRAAIADYDKALSLNPNFAEAYYNRGLTLIFLGNNKQGITDLSKAGELGLFSAYNIIKRFTEVK